jgi:hypothetical protein
MKSTNKSENRRRSIKSRRTPIIKFGTASPTMLFRTIILFCAMLVSALAIIVKSDNTAVWSFLGSVLIYAALTNGQKT